MAQQTAMQILIDEMTSYLEVHESPEAREVLRILKASAIRKYKKEEKEQIMNARLSTFDLLRRDDVLNAEQYYNETYGNKSK